MEPGTRLGTFEIISLLGKGGMGEVYRARDSKLGRDVAIKVLPESFANDPERLARFEREAQTLASLNHPNVATVYDFEHDAKQGMHYLVMEHIDGETLGERVARGSLSVSDALPLFIDIAHGLDAAHEAGIVHRDLKPDNVKINKDGVVKILDFGIAKSAGDSQSHDPKASTTPMSPIAVTAEGTFLGTPLYMSPEQARGKTVDKRTDIWAFGCCLFEALAGKLPFEGDTIADTVGAILEREPDWDELPTATPDTIRNLLQHCLEKEPRRRLSSAGDIAIALEDTREGLKRDSQSGRAISTAQRKSMPIWGMGIVVLLVILIGVGGMLVMRPSRSPEFEPSSSRSNAFETAATEDTTRDDRPIRLYSITLPPTQPVARDNYTGDYSLLTVSPDGREVMYPVQTEDGRIFMKRALDQLDARPVPGTENGQFLTVSPSGEWAIIHRDGAYWKIPYEGGHGEKILDATLAFIGVWEDDTHAIFGSPLPGRGLVRVDLDTGEQETLTELNRGKGEIAHVSYQVVPDKGVLFYMGSDIIMGNITLYAMSLDTMESKPVVTSAMHPLYVETGHVLYASKGHLMALPYDIDRLESTGSAKDVTPPYMASFSSYPQGFAVMPDGDLIYVRNSGFGGGERSLVWVDMDGQETEIDVPDMHYRNIALSPSGPRLRILFEEAGSANKWVYDVGSGLPPQQLTFDRLESYSLLWLGDGEQYVYSSPNENGGYSVYRRTADGRGSAEELARTTDDQWYLSVYSVTLDQNTLLGTVAFRTSNPYRAVEILLGDTNEVKHIFDADYETLDPILSPDGQWLAYTSKELGAFQLFVTSYPELEGKWRVSVADYPRFSDVQIWAPNGSAIYYRSDSHVIRVPVSTENGFSLGVPERLFEDIYVRSIETPSSYWALHPDGETFLFVKPGLDQIENSTELIVIENWLETLRNPDRAEELR